MPKLLAKTIKSEKTWSSPDGKMTIFAVTLETERGNAEVKTFSKAISEIGFEGEVESYEKEGKYGVETFVKQPQKEGGYGGYKGGKPQADPYTMYLSYAKDLAIASVHEGKFDDKVYASLLDAVSAGGAQLYVERQSADNKPSTIDVAGADETAEQQTINRIFNE